MQCIRQQVLLLPKLRPLRNKRDDDVLVKSCLFKTLDRPSTLYHTISLEEEAPPRSHTYIHKGGKIQESSKWLFSGLMPKETLGNLGPGPTPDE